MIRVLPKNNVDMWACQNNTFANAVEIMQAFLTACSPENRKPEFTYMSNVKKLVITCFFTYKEHEEKKETYKNYSISSEEWIVFKNSNDFEILSPQEFNRKYMDAGTLFR